VAVIPFNLYLRGLGEMPGRAPWYLKNSSTGGAAAVGLGKQTPGTPVVGDWDTRP
jgi:hypothetical protein